jgi:hypothetical protein
MFIINLLSQHVSGTIMPIVRKKKTVYYRIWWPAQRGQASLATLEGGSCAVQEAVVTIFCIPDNGCG